MACAIFLIPRKTEGGILSDKLNDSHLSCVAAAGADLVNSCVTAVLVSVLGSDLVEYLLSDIFLSNVSQNLALGVQGVSLPKSDQLFCLSANILSACNGALQLLNGHLKQLVLAVLLLLHHQLRLL